MMSTTPTSDVVATTTATPSKLNSFNMRLLRRLFDSSSPSSTVTVSSQPNRTMSQQGNDLFSAYAYSECLPSKLEKFLEHVCLRSKSGSVFVKAANFSYVDYTKR